MPSSYPAAKHTFVRPKTDGTETRTVAEVVSEVMDVVEALQDAVGIAPGGAYDSVKERIEELKLDDLADVDVSTAENGNAPTFYAGTWVAGSGVANHEGKTDTDDPHAAAKYLIQLGGGRRRTVGTAGHSSPALKDTWLDTTGS